MKKSGSYNLNYDGGIIAIEMQYGFRKRLSLTVYPDRRVVARVPYGFPRRKVEEYLQKKNKWIFKYLEHFEKHPPESEKKYVEGEEHSYLGKKYRLKFLSGTTQIKIDGDNLSVRVKNPDDIEYISSVLDRWYRKEAIRVLTPRFEKILKNLQYLDLPNTGLRFYKMKRRWGSCSAKHVITLNTELIKKDKGLIDYVIVHEICHLKVPAHNKAFYSLMESVLPDWKEQRKSLNESI
ncbi:MAG: SprT family zinc-dependent metalloprotease [Candidatus Marinimicrobia bacterium]|nr:SprT family zinc-dependent metalloprotease [Candidatus Neomarinimicrobiota bacterium]